MCEIQLRTCAVVIPKATVRITGASSVNLAGIWLEPGGIPESCGSQFASGPGCDQPYPVNVEVNGAEQTVSEDEARIMRDGFLQETHCL